MVSHEHGKEAITEFEIAGTKDCGNGKNEVRIHFYPHTGRTHQLRVHSAHSLGFGSPIKGDRLYGKESDRMYLHAESIDFTHPITGEHIHLEVPTPY